MDEDAQALLMVDKLEHGLYIQQEFHARGFRIPIVCGQTTASQRSKLRNKGAWVDDSWVIDNPNQVRAFRRRYELGEEKYVIGTKTLGTGADFVHLSMIVYASSMASRIEQLQTAGRGMRLGGSEKTIVIDCMDDFCDAAASRSHKRLREARKQGWEIELDSART